MDVTGKFTLQVSPLGVCPTKPDTILLSVDKSHGSDEKAECKKQASENPLFYECTPGPKLKAKTTGTLKSEQLVCAKDVVADIKVPAPAATPTPEAASARAGEAAAPAGGSRSLPYLPEAEWKKAMQEVRAPVAGKRVGNYYDQFGDLAVLFFDASGHAFFPMLDVIDEDDDIYVVVADYESQMVGVDIGVQGCNRPPVEPRVYKAGEIIATKTKPDEPVSFIVRAIGKCAGAETGGPQVVISKGQQQRVQTIPVNPLYRFAVGVAAAYDATEQREFRLQTLPGETVPRIAQSREDLGLTSLLYISFYPAARDFRKTNFWQGQRFQLFAGLDPRKLDRHLVVGVGYELTMGLNALVGWRVLTKQTILAEGSGLERGSPFDGDSRDLPTRERWEIGGAFLGLGLSSSLLSRLK